MMPERTNDGGEQADDQTEVRAESVGILGGIRRSYLFKFALALFLIVIIISIVGIYVQIQTTQTLENDVERQLELEAQSEAKQLGEWLHSNEMPVRMISAHPALNGSEPAAKAYIDEQQETNLPDRISAVHVVDTRADRINTSTNDDRIGENVSDASWMRLTAFSGFEEVVTSDPYRNPDGQSVVAFLSPVVEEPNWVVVMTVSTDEISFGGAIEGTFTEVVTPIPGSTRVLFSDYPHADNELSPYVANKSQVDIPELRDGVNGNSGFRSRGIKSDELGEQYVVAYAPVERGEVGDWIVIKHAPADNAYQLSDEVGLGVLAFIVIALGWVVLVGGTMGRNTARTIRQLSDRAAQIEAGTYDVDVTSNRKDEIGQLYRSIASMRDTLQQRIEDLEQSRAEAEQRNEQLQVLDRLLRHNLKNDMNVIRLHAEMARRETGDETGEHVEDILGKTDELLRKVDKQRTITHALAAETERQEIDIVDRVDGLNEAVRREVPTASLTVDAPESATVLAVNSIDEAIKELVENAIVHSDIERPEIAITVAVEADTVRVQVADNGPEIPETERQIIYGSREGDPLHHASGIGLWLVLWLVRLSGGEVSFDSREPRGNVVTLVLDRPGGDSDTSDALPEG